MTKGKVVMTDNLPLTQPFGSKPAQATLTSFSSPAVPFGMGGGGNCKKYIRREVHAHRQTTHTQITHRHSQWHDAKQACAVHKNILIIYFLI